MEYLIFLLLFAAGYWLGKWQNRHYRRDRLLAGQRLLQLRTLSLELKSLRAKVVSAQGRHTQAGQAKSVPMSALYDGRRRRYRAAADQRH